MTRDQDPVPEGSGPGGQGPGGPGLGDTGPGEEPGGWTGPRLRDVGERWEVVGDPSYLRGVLVTLRTDQVQMPDRELAKRDVIEHAYHVLLPGGLLVILSPVAKDHF